MAVVRDSVLLHHRGEDGSSGRFIDCISMEVDRQTIRLIVGNDDGSVVVAFVYSSGFTITGHLHPLLPRVN